MLSEDPTASPPIKPPMVTSRNPGLCDQCNKCLVLDDSVVEHYLETTAEQVLYIGHSSPHWQDISPMFGGIDYTRKDDLPDLPRLSHAAINGCEFCTAVKEGLKTRYQGASWWRPGSGCLSLRIQYAWESFYHFSTRLHSIVVSVSQDETKGWEEAALQFLVWTPEGRYDCFTWLGAPFWRMGRRRAEDSQPSSPNKISMANQWIQSCVERLDNCRGSGPATASNINSSTDIGESGIRILPTRLLDLVPDSASQLSNTAPGAIELFETASLRGSEKGISDQAKALRYAALSYCWGGVDPAAKTTNANFKHSYRNIGVSSLPKCLQDAVYITKKLGIRYLWIDALCIIQEDTDDWAREAGKMFEIFRNAFLTIGAASSISFDDGFLKCRPWPISIPFSSSCNSQVKGSITLSNIPIFPSWPDNFFPSKQAIERDLATSKWNTRGWVWQEQMLSERLLIFGNEMMHFKCTHCVQSEDNFYDRGSHTARDTTRQEWTRWMQHYSKQQLTYIRDKLPAVSGLAKMMDQRSLSAGEAPAEYLAGVWRSSQEEETYEGWRSQLCWVLRGQASTFKEMLEGLKSSAAETYSAPSWSWASRREGAHWNLTHPPAAEYSPLREAPQNFQAQFEEYHRVLMGPDLMGRVMPGSYLKVSGLMRRTPLPLSTAEWPGGRGTGLEWGLPSSAHLQFSLDWGHSPGEYDGALEGQIRLFGLRRWTIQWCDNFSGLLLLQNKEDGVFYRVGVFNLQGFIDITGIWQPLDRLEREFMDWQQTSVSIK